ncbi:MAG: glycosyltransferase involved in cell wall biosynthesis [Halieaceae bacterium]|jgi:glycosyltransferase involved in cell wall biosynthesis
MSKPRVSVCIAAYNHADLIEECVQSVLEQRAAVDLEVLIGVDQCPDDTLVKVRALAEQYPSIVECIDHAEKLPCGSDNYSIIINRASGDYIAHLDGDDFWLPGKLEQQLLFLDAHPSCSACYTNAQVINRDRHVVGMFTTEQPREISLGYLIERGNFLNHSSLLYRARHKDVITAIEAPFVDYQIAVALARQGNIGFISAPYTAYRYSAPNSIRVSHNDLVRELYWKAVESVGDEEVSASCLVRARAEFLRQTFFRSIKVRKISLFFVWWKRVSADQSKLALAFVCFVSILRRFGLEAISSVAGSRLFGRRKIFYVR